MNLMSGCDQVVASSRVSRRSVWSLCQGRLGLLLTVLCGSALAFQSSVAGGISGRVTAAADGITPLQGITVWACRSTGNDDWEWTNYGITDTAGEYIVEWLPAGIYRVLFEDGNGDYVSEMYDDVAGSGPWYGGDDISVPAETTVSGINAALAMGSAITGRVTADDGGIPLENIQVTAYRWNGSWWNWVSYDYTDENGDYRIGGLVAGTYRVRFSDWTSQYIGETYDGFLNIWPYDGGTDIDVPGGGATVAGINASLEIYASISGTVTDTAGGQPVEGVQVRVHGTWNSAVTDSAGDYTISWILPGTYHLYATPDISTGLLGAWHGGTIYAGQPDPPAGAASVTAASGQTVMDVDFQLERGASIGGIVLGANSPLPGARLKAFNAEYETTRQAVADDQGRYDLPVLLPGSYTLKVEAEGFADEWWDGKKHQSDAASFAVGLGDELTRNFNLSAGQSPALVEVTSDPAGADIYLDYHPTGDVTPAVINVGEVADRDWAGYRLASHVIVVKKIGLPRPPPQVVTAAEAETVVMHFDLASGAVGAISVVTMPEGAEVYVDYADAMDGVTPITVGNLAPGSHTILLRKSGYLQPRPITAWVHEDETTEVEVPLEPDTAMSQTMAQVQSVPPGIQVYVNYLPSGQVTDAVVGLMDPASHTGSGWVGASHVIRLWHSASHTILLRRDGAPPPAPRYVPEIADMMHGMLIHLSVDPAGARDSTGDGIPDWLWEQHGYDPLDPPDVNAIADASGMTFGDKLRAGLVPGDPRSRLEMGDMEIAGTPETGLAITFVFDTVPGRRYVVQAREKLMDGGWINISGIVTATASQTVFTAQIPPEMANQFYRLIVLAP